MRAHCLLAPLLSAAVAASSCLAAGGPTPVGSFGPTGIEISVRPDHTLEVLHVQAGSPAEDMVVKGEIIRRVNGSVPVHADDAVVFSTFKQLAAFITKAEATDGRLRLTVSPADAEESREVDLAIPVLGAYSKTWPLKCEKTRKVVRANVDYIASVAGETGEGLIGHSLYNGFAVLMLLSTGEAQDLELVRRIYRARMAVFDDKVGSHNWHNGIQGIAVCEYFLRTGDESVMPLIDAICEAIRKYQVHGGWSHWAKGINPQYTAGGFMNSAGTQNLTTLLLAMQCGAKVNPETLSSALRFFYRFAGHGDNPYGDHRPEGGLGSNGKTEMLALAMNAASRAENGAVYAMARDKCALTALYDYPALLRGHTGGNGAKWHGIAAALLAEKEPELYRNQLEHKKWFFELSRRHTGAMGACGSGRYDQESYGYATGLALTAPLKTLQITGAPRSPYAKAFRLPERPWGRRADLAFFGIEGGPNYRRSADAPHVELRRIAEADRRGVIRAASHPEHVYRQAAATAIRTREDYALIEELLLSEDPLARQTACMSINTFESWRLRFAIGTRGQPSIEPEHFTQGMFESLMAIITDPTQALWSVDQALAALAVASTAQVASRLSDLIPWLEHPEWWLNESATIALTPAMTDAAALDQILPTLSDAMASNVHAKGRGVMGWMLERATADASPEIQAKVAKLRVDVFKRFVSVPDPEPGVDLSGVTSVALEGQLGRIVRDASWQIRDEPQAILTGAQLSIDRLDEFRVRERDRVIDLLIDASQKLEGENRKKLGGLLVNHFRPLVVGDDPEGLKEQMASGQALKQMNKLLAIDRMAGLPAGWELLGCTPRGEQTWWHTSYEPSMKPAAGEQNRYRDVVLPERLTDWYEPDYDPTKKGWSRERAVTADGITPKGYGVSREWFEGFLPDAGEVLLLRKRFELQDLDSKMMRLTVYSRQGYDVYLNGKRLLSDKRRSKTWQARQAYFDDEMKKHLKVGTNVIAVRGFLQYFKGRDGGIDVFVEQLKALPGVH